jgi:predicted nucleic acid-binding Zn ribbon protein
MNKEQDNNPSSEDSPENSRVVKLKITKDIPFEFWRKENTGGDDDEPTIIEVTDANEGVPVRGKCIVCYKPIFEGDSDLFTCPNCNREAHYLCATIFITEHEICPVCSTPLRLDHATGKYSTATEDTPKPAQPARQHR